MRLISCDGRRLLGIASSRSRVTVVCCPTFWTSTTGAVPVTVMVSSTVPTRISPFTVAVNAVVSSTPSRLKVLNPGRVKVTVYVPGRKSTIR